MTPDLRAYVLGRSVVRVADLQRRGLTYSQACAALEDLEGDRLVGRQVIGGLPQWSSAFPVDEGRVAELRKLHGKTLRLVGLESESHNMTPKIKRLPRALVRRHVEEKHPGPASKCARCRR